MTFLSLTVPRGERKGKGARCDAVAEHSVANPAKFNEFASLRLRRSNPFTFDRAHAASRWERARVAMR